MYSNNFLDFLVRLFIEKNQASSLKIKYTNQKPFDNSECLVELPERKSNFQISVVPKEKQMVCEDC
jgi:hypothetical protein